jgi:hypothetical protein
MEAQAVINLYKGRGYNISRVKGDQEFVYITNDILPIQLNAAAADDRVHEVERSIRTIMERTRCTVQGLPFRRIPKVMMRAVIKGAHKALHQFPGKNSVSETLSPLVKLSSTRKILQSKWLLVVALEVSINEPICNQHEPVANHSFMIANTCVIH